jgi:hypothetical protein
MQGSQKELLDKAEVGTTSAFGRRGEGS